LAAQAAGSTGLGNVNPTLYMAAGTNAFHDVTAGDNIVPCEQGSPDCPASAPFQFGYSCGAGYDLVTGLGSVDAANLLSTFPPPPIRIEPSSAAVPPRGSAAFAATGGSGGGFLWSFATDASGGAISDGRYTAGPIGGV